MKLRILFSAALALLLTGCSMIPDGEPPKGNIVETPVAGALDFKDASNFLYTALAAYVTSERPDLAVTVKADAATKPYLDAILNRICRRSALKITDNASMTLNSYLKDNVWYLELFDAEHNLTVWQQRVVLKDYAAVTAQKRSPYSGS